MIVQQPKDVEFMGFGLNVTPMGYTLAPEYLHVVKNMNLGQAKQCQEQAHFL